MHLSKDFASSKSIYNLLKWMNIKISKVYLFYQNKKQVNKNLTDEIFDIWHLRLPNFRVYQKNGLKWVHKDILDF